MAAVVSIWRGGSALKRAAGGVVTAPSAMESEYGTGLHVPSRVCPLLCTRLFTGSPGGDTRLFTGSPGGETWPPNTSAASSITAPWGKLHADIGGSKSGGVGNM